MFMRAKTFERRMWILQRRRIPVIALGEAVSRLQRGAISNAETVITLDDGWASNLAIGLPILEKFGYPACIYLTTEHLAAGTEAFDVALSYMMRTSPRSTLTLGGIHPMVDGVYDIGNEPQQATEKLRIAATKALSLAERQRLLPSIAAALGVDFEEVFRGGRFALLNASEIRALSERGVDIELHTHTHHLPSEQFEAMSLEIRQNRAALQAITGREARHFCYPSGLYSPSHPEWLQRLGIASATLCEPGLNTVRTSPMLLKRYLDGEKTSDIVFEAEICGVRDLVRDLRSLTRRLFST